MKKIMIAFSAIAFAMGVQAASVSWKITDANAYAGQTVYAITGYSSSEVIAFFESASDSDWATAVDGAASKAVGSRGTASSASENVGSTIVFAIIDGSIAEGNAWAVSADISTSGFTYEGNEAKPGDLSFAFVPAASGTFTASAIPEPTSGLLMLLGMAGLALRRRRA